MHTALMALKWRHAGQACITANRVYVQAGVYEKFAEILKEKTSKLVVGHGAEKGTTMGPVTTERSLDKALNQVEDAKKHGGQVVLGGGKVTGKGGYFFEPTIILGAKKEMLITEEETFAPVLALYSFDTEEEAVSAANNTSMGLASYYFTKNIDRTWRLLENLEAGMIGMNTGMASSPLQKFYFEISNRLQVTHQLPNLHLEGSRNLVTAKSPVKTWLSTSTSLPRLEP